MMTGDPALTAESDRRLVVSHEMHAVVMLATSAAAPDGRAA
jgi:hypothetical protein